MSVRLREALTMGIYGHHLIEYSPGRRIHFWGEHKYNIMATGVERIEIDLKKVSESRTRITIDYFETTRLMGFIPVTYRTGRWQENHVIKTIFGK